MPEYEHVCKKCNQEFEQEYSIKANPPTKCPLCGEEGHVERLISGGNGKGIVNLTGQDLRDKIQSDAMKMKKRALTNENYAMNLFGTENIKK